MRRANSLKKTLILGKIEGQRRVPQRMRWLDSFTNSMDMNLSKLNRSLGCWSPWGLKELDMTEFSLSQVNGHSQISRACVKKAPRRKGGCSRHQRQSGAAAVKAPSVFTLLSCVYVPLEFHPHSRQHGIAWLLKSKARDSLHRLGHIITLSFSLLNFLNRNAGWIVSAL